LHGTKIKDVGIEELINNGKSAPVFHGKQDDKSFAIKIFDNEIVERHGVKIQQQRIERELSLKEHKIPNLVKILDGGKVTIQDTEYFYLIMGFIKGINLKEYIQRHNDINISFIVEVTNILIDITERLFQNTPSLVHRDIKSENIMVSDNGEIILMDLGVLKFVGVPSMTDVGGKQFLGTLRYAPPEFLMRDEKDETKDWRAINIYQIGAVLHDLIMKNELFAGIEPYGALVSAIKEDMPQIISTKYHPDLIRLARNMLHKKWEKRLELASIETIKSTLQKCLLPQDEPTNIYNEIKAKALPIQEELTKFDDIIRGKAEKERLMNKIHDDIWNIIEEYFIQTKDMIEMMNKIDSSRVFSMDDPPHTIPIRNFKFYQFKGKLEYGFAKPFFILFMVENDASNYAKICVLGIIPDIILREKILEPEKLIYELFSKERKYPPPHIRITNPPELKAEFTCIFDGIVEFGDNSLKELIGVKIAQMLSKITERMKPDVQEELEQRKKK
jgi:serine/threonine protein kinase